MPSKPKSASAAQPPFQSRHSATAPVLLMFRSPFAMFRARATSAVSRNSNPQARLTPTSRPRHRPVSKACAFAPAATICRLARPCAPRQPGHGSLLPARKGTFVSDKPRATNGQCDFFLAETVARRHRLRGGLPTRPTLSELAKEHKVPIPFDCI